MLARYYLPCYIVLWCAACDDDLVKVSLDLILPVDMPCLVLSCLAFPLQTSGCWPHQYVFRAETKELFTTAETQQRMTTIYWAPENYCQITEVWLQHGVVFLISIKEAGELNKKVAWKIPVGVSATESFCFKDSCLLTHKSCYWVVLTQFRTSLVIW